jgi:pimeloyl-ACP methyl ester carboxylesterase
MLYTDAVVFVPPFESQGPRDASALLLIAPLGRDRTSWGMQVPAFSTDFRTIVYDARGTGAAANGSVSQTSIAEMAHDAIAVLDELEVEQAHVAGWSMGAAVATAVALAAPDRVRSLSLYTPWGRTDRWLALCFRFLADVARHSTPADFEATVTWLLLSREFINAMEDFDGAMAATAASPGYPEAATLIAQLEASIQYDVLEEVARISCPTLLVAGERDQLVPSEYARELAAQIPTARLEVVNGPGSTHGLLVERATEFNDLALGFLREVERDL